MNTLIPYKIIASICFTIFLTACGGPDEASARKAVLAALNEPDSIKFGSFSLVGENNACLTFNAKDSTGEYFGDQQAYLRRNIDGWSVVIGFIADHEDCIAATKNTLAKTLDAY